MPDPAAQGAEERTFIFPVCTICGESTYTCRCPAPENRSNAEVQEFVLRARLEAVEGALRELLDSLTAQNEQMMAVLRYGGGGSTAKEHDRVVRAQQQAREALNPKQGGEE